ncbi:MAG: sulfotransferase [Bacteroidetes bacterium]|nr:sulfotransferase [Bacteroidota bacterium]
MEDISNIPIFFVVGRPRSGTTLLRTLFDAHPNVSFPPECQFIVNLFPKYGHITNWTEKDLLLFYNDLISQWLFDTWNMDYNKLKKSILLLAGNNSYGAICKVVYKQYTSLFEKGELLFIGDKNPGYAIYSKLLLKIFPEAKFIHIIRDYRDNFVSVKNVDFELPVPSLVVQKWKYFVKKFNKDSAIKPEAFHVIKYEDLANEPKLHMQQLCNFIGIEYNAIVFDFHEKKDEILKTYPPGYINTYHSNLMHKVNTGKIGVWKKQLSPLQIKLMDATAGKIAEQTGYPRIYTMFNLWINIIAFPGRLYAGLLYVSTIIVDKFPYKLRIAILIKGPLFLASLYLSIFNPKKMKEMQDVIIKRK